jgi:hypothetical protein
VTASSARRSVQATVAANPCTAIAATAGSVMALLTWGGTEVGVDAPGWVAALAAGAVISGALAFPNRGLVGLIRFILFGRATRD